MVSLTITRSEEVGSFGINRLATLVVSLGLAVEPQRLETTKRRAAWHPPLAKKPVAAYRSVHFSDDSPYEREVRWREEGTIRPEATQFSLRVG